VKSYLTYASKVVQFTDKDPSNMFIYYQQTSPSDPYLFAAFKIEPKTYVYSLGTINKKPIPRNDEDAIEFCNEHKMEEALPLVRDAKSITKFNVFHKLGNEWHNFSDLNVHGYVALGDAVCNFNPVYGQGITTAYEAILLLDKLLREDGYHFGIGSKFQKLLDKQLAVPWLLSTLSDLRFPETEGGSSLKFMVPVAGWMLNKITIACAKDAYVFGRFLEVMHMDQGFLWHFFSPKFYWHVFTC
jgi:hypothetical protein